MVFTHSEECLSHTNFLLSLVKRRLGLYEFVHFLFTQALLQGTAFPMEQGRKSLDDCFFPDYHVVDPTVGSMYWLARDKAGIYVCRVGDEPMAALIAPASVKARPPAPGEKRGGAKAPIPSLEDQSRTLHHYRGWLWTGDY
jgi:hypothetical protein